MRAGYNEDRTGYYVRTDRALWIRSHWHHDTGTIRLAWHMRYNINGLTTTYMDENEEPIEVDSRRQSRMQESPWVDVEPFLSLDRMEIADMGKGDKRGLIEGLMRHQALLLAMGLGEGSREIAEWFAEPEKGDFMIVGLTYAIADGDGAFKGLDDMTLVVESRDGDRMAGAIIVEGDDERYAFSSDMTPEFVAQFVRSTTPRD